MTTDEEARASELENILDLLADALSNIRDLAAPEDATRGLEAALSWHIEKITHLIRDEDPDTEGERAEFVGQSLESRLRRANPDAADETIVAVVKRVIEEIATQSVVLDRRSTARP